MNVLLATIAVLGLGALIISAYIFAVAARHFVSSDEEDERRLFPPQPDITPRRAEDRRQAPPPTEFPIMVNGEWVREDRRKTPDRRKQPIWKIVEAGV